MYYRRIAKFIITLFLSVFLYSCETTSDKNSPKSQKLYTTFQEIVNDVNSGETIDLDEYSEKYIITDYNAEINKKLTIRNGNFKNMLLKVKDDVKLEKVRNLSIMTSSNLTIQDSELNSLLIGTNTQSRNAIFDLKVTIKNTKIANEIKISCNSQVNITGEKTIISKVVVTVAKEECRILCADGFDIKNIKDIVFDENTEKLEDTDISQGYKIVYHLNFDEQEDIEDFFSENDRNYLLRSDIAYYKDFNLIAWYHDKEYTQIVEGESIDVSDKKYDVDIYAKWEKEVAADEVAQTINGLAGGLYKITVTSNMTSEIFANTSSAIKKNASTKIILDLSKTLELTELPEEAFRNCDNLLDITLPNSVKTIGAGAFRECDNLKTLIIPDSVISIGNNAFCDCKSLTSVTIPDSVISMGEYLFSACTNLTDVTISDNVTAICDGTFYDCSSLTSVTIPANVIRIGQKVFTGCSNLTEVIFEDTESSWYYTDSCDYTGGDGPLYVRTPTTNATNLKKYGELYGYKYIGTVN